MNLENNGKFPGFKSKISFVFKETVHPKMKILSSFTHPQVDPNLYECVCSEHKGRYFVVIRTNTFIQVWIYLRLSK